MISTTITVHGRSFTISADTAQLLAQAAADLTQNADRLAQHLPPADADPPACQHGPRVHKTGTNDRGRWSGWFCPLGQDRAADRCAPVFTP